MAVAPTVQNSTQTDGEDALSPTTIVLNALRKAGLPLTTENVRRYVTASMRQGNEAGTDIQGLRIENPGESASSATRGGSARGGGGGRSTLPVDLGLGPTNEANWQPTTTSAPPAAQDVLSMQNATNPAMRAAVPEIPVDPAISPPPMPQIPKPPMQLALDDAVATRPQLPAPPPQIAGPPALPEAPVAAPNTPIPMPGPQAAEVPPPPEVPRSPGLSIESVPMPPPQTTNQAPSAASIPPSGGLSIEDRMVPRPGGMPNLPTGPNVIEPTTPILNRIVQGAASGAGTGRLAGPWGTFIGGVAGAAPGLWDLGKHIVGR